MIRARDIAGRSLLAHLALYLVVVVALLATTHLRDSWSLDDGAYATQVKVLEQTGGWAYPYPYAAHDPGMVHTPVSSGLQTTDGRLYSYVKLPAWIYALRASVAVFGAPLGFYVPSALGALAAAASAWWLAGRFDRRLRPWAFWAVAASPLLVHTTAMWAHTTGAALGGVVAVGLLDLARGPTGERSGRSDLGPVVSVALALGALCLVRNEGQLLAAATLLTLGVIGLWRGPSLAGRLRSAAVLCAPSVLMVGAVIALGRWWTTRLAPGPYLTVDTEVYDGSLLKARQLGAVRTFVDGFGRSSAGTSLALLAIAVFALAGWLLGRPRSAPAGLAAIVVGLALVAVRTLVVAELDLGGLLVAVPLLAVAATAPALRRIGAGGRALAGWILLFGLALLATEYAVGGSRDWGGRFTFVVLVPMLVSAVVVADRTVATLAPADDRVRRAAVALLGTTVVVPTLLGLVATREVRARFGAQTRQAVAPGSQVVIRTDRQYSRGGWRVLPEARWLTAEPLQARAVLAELRREGVRSITVAGPGAVLASAPGFHRRVVSDEVVVFTRSDP